MRETKVRDHRKQGKSWGGGALKEELGTVALNGTALNGTMTVLMKKQYFFDARA